MADLAREPGDTPYDSIKARLVDTFSQSKERKIIRILEETQLGDLKPSQLLRKMQNIAGTTCSADVIRTVWLRALPSKIRAILASLNQEEVDQLAVTADKILEVDATATPVFSVQQSLEKSLNERLIEEIAELKKLVLSSQNDNRQGRSRDRTPFRYRRRTPSRHRKPGYLCYPHFKYGDKAKKCEQPCAWGKAKEEASSATTGQGK